MADEDYDYTPAQKQKIARHFVLTAPDGEVQELTKDLRRVAEANICDDRWTHETMTEYNKRKFVIIKANGTKVLCCPQGEVGPNRYLHPGSQRVFEIDPVEQKVTNDSDGSNLMAGGDVENFRGATDEKLQEYLTAYYEDGSSNPSSQSRGVGGVYASNEGAIAIVISFKNINISNYWTGGWQSEWTYNSSSGGRVDLEGRIRLNVHYFEDGNVQLNGVYQRKVSINVSDPATTAAEVMAQISELETNFLRDLGEFYVNMHETTFKNMRRFLPKIGKKMDWRASVHQLVAQAAGGNA